MTFLPMEAARALEQGFVTDRTTVITVCDRVYAIGEKIVAGDGTVDAAGAIEAMTRTAKRVIALDLARVATGTGSRGNAEMFGAIIGSGILPLTAEICRRAIEDAGISVASNLAGFAAGVEAANTAPPVPEPPRETGPVLNPVPETFSRALTTLPAVLRALTGHALARLTDYQDQGYAALFLKRLEAILAADRKAGGDARGYALSLEAARRLAAWMSFEDAIRVAELKTSPGRLARICAEFGAGENEPLHVTDFLSPRREDLVDLLPPTLARLAPSAPATARARGFSLHYPTSTPLGFAAMKAVAALKRWRPRTRRYAREHAAIEAWLAAIAAAAGSGDYALACRVAGLAAWARGYGDVRAAGAARLAAVVDDFTTRLAEDRNALVADVAAALADARDNPDGHCHPH